MGYFIERKLELPEVLAELIKYRFVPGNYDRLIVTWGATPQAEALAKKHKVQLWNFRNSLLEFAEEIKHHKTYFTDDTARTIQLFAKAADR